MLREWLLPRSGEVSGSTRPGRFYMQKKTRPSPGLKMQNPGRMNGTKPNRRLSDSARSGSGLGAGVDAAPQLAAEAEGDASAEQGQGARDNLFLGVDVLETIKNVTGTGAPNVLHK